LVAGSSGSTGHGVIGGTVVIAFFAQIVGFFEEGSEATLGGTDICTGLAERVIAGLSRVEPKLNRAGHDARGNFPDISGLVVFDHAITQLDDCFCYLIIGKVFF
jgi:hypothetical protein